MWCDPDGNDDPDDGASAAADAQAAIQATQEEVSGNEDSTDMSDDELNAILNDLEINKS